MSAEDAAVLKGHETFVFLSYYPALLNQARVYIDFAYVVYDYGEFDSFFICEDPVQKRSLTAPQISRQQQYR